MNKPQKSSPLHRVRPSAKFKVAHTNLRNAHNREGVGFFTATRYCVKWDNCRAFQNYDKRFIEAIPTETK